MLLAGCGSQDFASLGGQSVVLGQVDTAHDEVVLNWSGGESPLYPGRTLSGLDLGKYSLSTGGSLSDRALEFKAEVLAEVLAIVSAMPGANVQIINSSRPPRPGQSTVHIAQAHSETTAGRIGEGEYDPCNLYGDDAAVIFGDELLRLGRTFSFDEWVLIFANVTAHEIGHTLGYGHVERESAEGARPIYVELMLATHSVDEMIRPQRYLSDESNCPDHAAQAARLISGSPPVCGIVSQ